MKTLSHCLVLLVLALFPALPARAQVPSQLQQTIAAPTGGLQGGAELGSSVAVDGPYTVAGAPYDPSGTIHSGVVKIFDTASGAQLFKLLNPGKFGTGNFGTTVAIFGTHLVVGDPRDTTTKAHEGSAYVYDLASVTPTVPMLILKRGAASGSEDNFGSAVAIEGTRIVVGAAGESTGASGAGSAYVYDLNAATPDLPVLTLRNPSPVLRGSFGIAVALSGPRLAVGASGEKVSASSMAGSAFVYDLSSAMPTVPAFTVNSPTPTALLGFGYSVAISGSRLAVGSYFDSYGVPPKIFGYDLAGATPTVPMVIFNHPTPAANDGFGYSLAMSGTRLVAGAYATGAGATSAGSAYVYDFGSATPAAPVFTFQKANPMAYDDFGYSVAISGGRVVVGVAGDDSPAPDAGNAYIYDLDGSAPAAPIITQNDPGPVLGGFGGVMAVSGTRIVVGTLVYDLASTMPATPVLALHSPAAGPVGFGSAVAISGTRVAVSGPYDFSNPSKIMGIVCIFDLTSATPTMPVLTISDPNPSPSSSLGDEFGRALAMSGSRLVVGAPTDSTDGNEAGRVYVYDLDSATPTTPAFVLHKSTPVANNWFGYSVAISGTHVVAGTSPGRGAYVFDLNSATPSVPTLALSDPTPQGLSNFGAAVGISDTRVVVGAPFATIGGIRGGSAFVYDLTSPTPMVPVATLAKPTPVLNDLYGNSVVISGTRVVVGASQDDTRATDSGRALVFDLASANPTAPVATLDNPTPAVRDYFGGVLAIDGTTIIVGTPNEGAVVQGTGAIYVFGPNPNDQDNNGLLDSWEIARFGNATGHNATDDDDQDGFINLLKEAFGSTPTARNTAAAVPAPGVEDGYLTITLTKHPGVNYEVQSAATPDAAAFSAATTTVLVNDATTLKVRDNFLLGTTPGRFLRVKVTAAP